MKFFSTIILAAGILAAVVLPGRADTITWNGSASTSWTNPVNWTPQEVPTTNDHVIISSGSVVIPTTGTFGIMDWSGGTINGSITVISNAVLNLSWNSTTFLTGSLTNAGTVNVTGTGQLQLSAGPINNLAGGIFDFKTNQMWLGLPAGFYNAGLVRKTGGTGTTQIGSAGNALNFTNANTGTVEADTGTLAFNSSGLVDGTYQALGTSTINFASGTFTVANPVFSGTGTNKFTGTTLILPTNVVPGLQLLGGTVNLGPTFQGGSITNLILAGSVLGGTNIITGTATLGGGFNGILTVATNAVVTGLAGTAAGALTVNGGGMVSWTNSSSYTCSITVQANGILNMDWNTTTFLTGSLTNAGTVNVHGTGQLQLSAGPINNLAGGIFDFKTNQMWLGSPAAFNNAGLVRKTGGTGTTQIGTAGNPFNFTNATTGTVEADIGTLAFNSSGLIDGTYQAFGNGTINFAAGTFTVANPVFSGTGTNKFTGTTLILPNDVVPGLQLLGGTVNLGPTFQGGSITNLILPGPVLGGTNIITGTATLAGGFNGNLTVASNAVVTGLAGTGSGALTVNGGGLVSWTNSSSYACSITVQVNGILNMDWNTTMSWAGSLTNAGTVNVHGIGQLQLSAGSINNLAGGIIDYQTNQTWLGLPASFYNAGLVRKTGGTGTTQIGTAGNAFNFTNANSGTVEADIGTLSFNSSGLIDGTYQAFGNGTINFASGTFTAVNPVFSGTGTNKFTGTTLILPNNAVPGLQLLGGTVDLGPTFQGGSITNLILAGPALGGTNIITGTATLGGGFSGNLTVASNAVVTGLAGIGAGALTINGGGLVSWTNSGNYACSITVQANGILNMDWNTTMSWAGSLTNAGTVNVRGVGQLDLSAGPVNNLAGGIIDYQTNQTWFGLPAAFNNAGLVRKTGGTGTTQIGSPGNAFNFTNSGTVEVDTGTLSFNSGGLVDGTYQAFGNGTINFAAGTFTVANPMFSGTGTNKFTGTTLILPNNAIPGLQLLGGTVDLGPAFQGGSITNLILTGPALGGTNIITGTATLSGGFSGNLTVASNAVVTGLAGTGAGALTINGGGLVSCTNSSSYACSITVQVNGILNMDWNTTMSWAGSLTNAGTVNVRGIGQLDLSSGSINNLAGGIVDYQTNQTWLGLPAAFNNAGLVRKTGGTGTTQIGAAGNAFNFTNANTGTVEADIGTLAFNSSGLVDGTYRAFGTGTINFAFGTFTAVNPVFSGTGTNKFTGTALILPYNVVPGLQLISGTVNLGPTFQGGSITNLILAGPVLGGTNIITGTATLGGGFNGILTVASNAMVTGLGGTAAGALTINGGGLVSWTNSSSYACSITVQVNGILNMNWNTTMSWAGSLTNAGTVNVHGIGQLDLSAGSINNLAGGIIDYKTNQLWLGLPAVFNNAGLVRKTGGTGTTQIGAVGNPFNFTNTSTVEADSGTLSFAPGGYADTSAAHLAASLGGPAAINNGVISFASSPTINANLVASTRNGFVPSPGQIFKILSYPSLTNQISHFSGLDLGGGVLLQPQYTPTSLMLLVSSYDTNAVAPQLFLNRSLGGVAVVWPAAFTGWTLQSTTNLVSPVWLTVPNVVGNTALVPGVPPQFYRLQN